MLEDDFEMSVGDRAKVEGSLLVEFLDVKKDETEVDDVQQMPDLLLFALHDTKTGSSTQFKLHQSFYPFRVGHLNIMVTKRLDGDTFEFRLTK